MAEETGPPIVWPEPKFVPRPSGGGLNPERVSGPYEALRAELTIGEQIALWETLGQGIADVVRAGDDADGED